MSKHQKALERLCQNPPPADFKWAELQQVLEHLDYELFKGKGSRRKFIHRKTKHIIICHEPHPSPDVGKACIKDVVENLKTNGDI